MQLTLRQAASYLQVGEDTVQKWIAERDLPVHRVNERLHLNAIEVWEWAVERGIPVSKDLLSRARRTAEDVPPLSELLEIGGVHRGIGGRDKNEILAHIVRLLPLPGDVDRDHLLAVIEAREAMGSTGIGDGIAIPHVRNPILLHVNRPQVSLFLLDQPVDFDSIDHEPVHSVFLIISCSIPEHLRILAQMGFALRDPGLRDLLRQRRADEEILERFRNLVGP